MLLASIATGGEQWRKLPPPPGRADGVSAIAIEGDTLWALAGKTVAYWDGREWHVPAGPPLRAGMYLATLKGGGSRPLILSQPGTVEGRGGLYRLSDGEATQFAEFQYDGTTEYPGLEVASSGQIINWKKGMVAVWNGSKWNQANAPDEKPLWLESRDAAHLYYPLAQKIVQIDRASTIRETATPLSLAKSGPISSVRWGERRGLLLRDGREPNVLDLVSGEVIAAPEVDRLFRGLAAYDLFGTRDGSAWLLMAKGESRHFVRVRPNGDAEHFRELLGPSGQEMQLSQYPQSVLETKEGALWIGGAGNVISRLQDGKVTRFGTETGYDLAGSRHLVEDGQSNVYTANRAGVHVCFLGSEPPAHLPPPRQPQRLDAAKWSFASPLAAAWLVGTTIYGTKGDGLTFLALDTENGEVRYTRQLGKDNPFVVPWLCQVNEEGTLDVAVQNELVRLRAKDGEVLERWKVNHDPRIAPWPVKDGFVVTPEARGSQIARVDLKGQTLWKCDLPGYSMMHPAGSGKRVVFQTRGSSYGGQATVCIDVETGDMSWEDTTDAYGCGVTFFDDEHFVVEADVFMSPEKLEGWLICRKPETGERLWHYRSPGMISHPPLMDRRTARVYGVFDRGEIVCLRCEDGSVGWKQALSENAYSESHAEPAWSPHFLEDGRLGVVDANCVLHLLDAKTGKFQGSIALEPHQAGAISPRPELIARPWIVGDMLFVASKTGVLAYELPAASPER